MGKLNKKTKAKAYGLKSTFYYGSDVYTSQYGNANEAILTQKIYTNDLVDNLYDERLFDIDSKKQSLLLERANSNDKVPINNPLINRRQDPLNMKANIEKKIFGTTFEDSLHIQIAYNILDIKKILTLNYYDVINSIKSLVRNEKEEDDFVGSINYIYKYNQLNNKVYNEYCDFLDDAQRRLPYFDAFMQYKRNKKGDWINVEEADEYNYNVLRIISLFRQFIAHARLQTEKKQEFKDSDFVIFNSNYLKTKNSELSKIIEDKFSEALKSINANFNANSRTNLRILSDILKVPNDNKLANDYYKFSIYKDNKNLGINIKKLRETVYDLINQETKVREQENDSIRNKINKIFDYLVYLFLTKDSLYVKYVEKLRASANDDEKSDIYYDLAKQFIKTNTYKSVVSSIKKEVKVKNNKGNEIEYKIEMLSPNNFSLFSKSIYYISSFLSIKEKNNLITSLINKFDNISTFLDVFKSINQPIEFDENYKLFNESLEIKKQLRIVQSLSGMRGDPNKPAVYYNDALISMSAKKEELKDIKEYMEVQPKGKKQFRNFIINNVVKSTRFQYIVKYVQPNQIVEIIKNEKVAKSILLTIPEPQLERYRVILNIKQGSKIDVVNSIYNSLSKFNYDVLYVNKDKIENKEKVENIKALVNLYYTIPYLLIKNLVNINAIFIMGFECFERDYYLGNSTNLNLKDNIKVLQLLNIVKENAYSPINPVKRNERKKLHVKRWMEENISEYLNNKIGFGFIRNRTLHMNYVTSAYIYMRDIDINLKEIDENNLPYYDIYQYVVQKKYLEDTKSENVYSQALLKYRTYNKDFTKILYTPFAYNVARYKNLTIKELFYDKYDKKVDEGSNNK